MVYCPKCGVQMASYVEHNCKYMINEKANTQTAQQLANSYNRNVAIYTNSLGQVNIQFESEVPLEPFNTLRSVVVPKES